MVVPSLQEQDPNGELEEDHDAPNRLDLSVTVQATTSNNTTQEWVCLGDFLQPFSFVPTTGGAPNPDNRIVSFSQLNQVQVPSHMIPPPGPVLPPF